MKIDIVKVAQGAGILLGFAGTLLTGWAGQQTAKANIATQVAKALADQVKPH